MHTVMIAKPGKDATKLENRRPVHLMDPGAKAVVNAMQAKLRMEMNDKWPKTEYGAVEGRNTSIALVTVDEIRTICERQGRATSCS